MKRLTVVAIAAVVAVVLLAMALVLPGLLRTAPAQAEATTVTTQQKIEVGVLVFVPCANGGAGEDVALSGNLHVLFHFTEDGSGGLHIQVHENPGGISGTGLVSGDKYRAVGEIRDAFNVKPPFLAEFSSVGNFRIIGEGPGNNFLVHETLHVTVNANGEVTAEVDILSVECK